MTQEIDHIIQSLQHPFFMMLGGLVGWFALVWATDMKGIKKKKIGFWADQKEEIIASLVLGLIFIVWDDEAIAFYYYYKGIEGTPEIEYYYYLIICPFIDSLIWSYQKVDELRKRRK